MAGTSDANALILKMSADISGMQKQISAAVGIVDSGSAKMVLRSKEAAAAIEKSFGTVTVDGFKTALAEVAALQDRLTAAQVAGNAEEAKALRAELLLRGQVQKAAVAQLETQLAIARAAGSKGQVAQLTEALALQSQISKFQGVGLTGAKALHEAEAAVVALAAAERAAEGANVGKALDKVFDRSRLAVVEEGSAKIPIFGSAIEALGPAGIAAAAGIVAVGIAAEQARKAMEWADELDKTAKKLGVTTTSLQQFDYAAVASSIGIEQGREALATFNEQIGKFQSHIGDGRFQKWAEPLKLSRDEVNKTTDTVAKLQLVIGKIANLSNPQQRAAAAKAFGLEQLLPIIQQGGPAIEEFIGKMREAQAAGGVIDPRDIARAAEMNDKVEALTYLIGQHFKQAFIDAAPAIEKVAEFIEHCTKALAGFLGDIPLAIRGITELLSFLPKIPAGVQVERVQRVQQAVDTIDPFHLAAQAFRSAVQNGRTAELGDKVKNLLAGGKVDLTGSDFEPTTRNGVGQQLAFDKAKGSDRTEEFDKSANEAYEAGLKALIEAQKALTGDIQARADAEKQAIAADLAKKTNDKGTGSLDLEEKKIQEAAKKGLDARAKEQLALIEKAKTEEQNAALARKELIDRQTAFAIEDRTIELYKSKLDAQIAELTAQGSIATTAKDRAEIELRILALRQQLERDLHDTQIDRRTHTATNPGGDLSPDQATKLKGDFNATQDAQAAAQRQQIFLNANPLAAYAEKLKDFDTEVQTTGVHALESLSTGLADAIVNAHSLGDVAKNVFRQMIADLLAAAIRKDIEAPLLAVLGFADGGRVRGPGSSTSDSIPALLSDGEFVVKASAAQKHAALLEAINNDRTPRFAQGGWVAPSLPALTALKNMSVPQGSPTVIYQPFHFHAEGAVMTEDLLNQANGYADRRAAQAGQWARTAARQDSRQSAYVSQINQ